MSGNFAADILKFVSSDTFAWVLTFALVIGSLIFAYIDNIIPLVGLLVVVPCLGLLAIIATAMATGESEQFFKELFGP